MNNKLTGYPSIDKPWMKFYTEEKSEFIHESMYECLVRNNVSNRNIPALKYFGNVLSFGQMIEKIDHIASLFHSKGIKKMIE